MMTAGSNDLMIDGNKSPPLYPHCFPGRRQELTSYIKAVVDDQQIQISSLKNFT